MKLYESIQLKFFNLNLFFGKLNKKKNTNVIDKKKKKEQPTKIFVNYFTVLIFFFLKINFFGKKIQYFLIKT